MGCRPRRLLRFRRAPFAAALAAASVSSPPPSPLPASVVVATSVPVSAAPIAAAPFAASVVAAASFAAVGGRRRPRPVYYHSSYRVSIELALSLYQTLFHFKALLWESVILVLPPSTCRAHTIALLVHDHRATYPPHTDSPLYMPYTIQQR